MEVDETEKFEATQLTAKSSTVRRMNLELKKKQKVEQDIEECLK